MTGTINAGTARGRGLPLYVFDARFWRERARELVLPPGSSITEPLVRALELPSGSIAEPLVRELASDLEQAFPAASPPVRVRP